MLACDLAQRRGATMAGTVIAALEAEIARDRERKPLAARRAASRARLSAIADDLAAKGRLGGRRMTRDEIDELWDP